MSNRILITGGTGFAGSHLIEYLLSQNERDIHTTTMSSRPSFVDSLIGRDAVHQVDLTNYEEIHSLLTNLKPTHIYHLASSAAVGSSFAEARLVLEAHFTLQLNLLEAIKSAVPKARVLAVGSALEYLITPEASERVSENFPIGPHNPYAASKAIQTIMSHAFAHAYSMDMVIVRPFNHIGERQAPGFVVSDFASQIVRLENSADSSIKVGNLSAIRDFSDVKDVARAYHVALTKGNAGEIYNIGSGTGTSIQQILDILLKKATKSIAVEIDPNKVRPIDIEAIIANNDKIRALGWQPTRELEETLHRILQWWRLETNSHS